MSRWLGGLVFGVSALLTLGWLFVSRPWSGNAEPPPRPREAFAADRASAPGPVPFDAKRALGYLETICKIGPRVSGSPGMKKQQELLRKHFEAHGGKAHFQHYTVTQLSRRQPVDMANLIVSWWPERPQRVILCAHYDTRPIADQETDRGKWGEPFVSANDGGSGVALLMELAHHIKDLRTGVGVDFVFFDGEEYVFEPERDRYFFGSEHFAQQYRTNRPRQRYIAAVLLDMVGGKDAKFPIEQNSWFKAAALVQDLWRVAGELECHAFRPQMGPNVRDDHLALNGAGIPAVDVIDFEYPHWHRLTDVPANCSADSLDQVARVLTVWLQRLR